MANPLAALKLEDRPCLGGFPYPLVTDPEFKYDKPGFEKALQKVDAVYSPHRENLDATKQAISDFIAKGEEKVLIIYGDGGVGKSWFVKDSAATQ